MQAIYAGLFGSEKFKQDGDHLIAKIAKDASDKHIASGLHTFANLGPLPQTLNREKGSYFNPDHERSHRPANRHPGGAWDPEPTPYEMAYMELMERDYGQTIEESLRNLIRYLDRQARAYEKHARDTHDVEILVDRTWFECRVPPEWKARKGPRYKGDEGEPDEKNVQIFMTMLQKQSGE
ncbi:hypothetical protein [Burkholderia sp. 8Y]|uniref:hypothetical protein n=1 Tax=Burkholderia sp. 8Y TaxID=2653133 RepID=UPI001356F504|nr:hypothetical protein [Burkholderia sp. 8Y]